MLGASMHNWLVRVRQRGKTEPRDHEGQVSRARRAASQAFRYHLEKTRGSRARMIYRDPELILVSEAFAAAAANLLLSFV